MKAFFKEYFNYTQREKRGILFLVILIIIVFIIPTILENFRHEKHFDYSTFESQLSQCETDIKPEKNKSIVSSDAYFNFDPNTIDQLGLIELGLSKQQAQTLINYRKAGGKFKKVEDLKKIYAIDDILYKNLKPFVKIHEPERIENTTNFNKSYESNIKNKLAEYKIIELNTADSIDLIKLPGIGSVLARRILEYRNSLGGYYQSNQLLEVFGVSTETFQSISNYISIDTSHIQKIDLNKIEFKTLNKHPYISYANTKSLLKYRQLMGSFSSKDDILINHLVDSATYAKIKHYVIVNNIK